MTALRAKLSAALDTPWLSGALIWIGIGLALFQLGFAIAWSAQG